MPKRVYKGSLLAQKILLNQNTLDQTPFKEEGLPAVSPRYKRLTVVHLLAIGLVGFVIFHFIALVVLTFILLFLMKLDDSFAMSIADIWIGRLNIAMAVLGICCFFMAMWTYAELEQMQKNGLTQKEVLE